MNRVRTGGTEFRQGPARPFGLGGIRRFSSRLRRSFSFARPPLRTALLLVAACGSVVAADADADANTAASANAEADVQEAVAAEESPWDWSATVRGGLGYKDNILLSDFFKESSVF